MTIENDGRFPDDSPVLVWYPPPSADNSDRSAWAWLPGTILSQCCADEWYLVAEAPALAEPDPNVPNGDAPENVLYPACFRDASELRVVSVQEWQRVWDGLDD